MRSRRWARSMASAPSEPRSVFGRVDRLGRLISADPELEALQVEAGARLGSRLALPQVAAVARLAQSLGIAVSRQAVAADGEHDIDLWVRAVPEGEETALIIDGWARRPAGGPRLAGMAKDTTVEPLAASSLEWSSDEELRLTSLSPDLARALGTEISEAVGRPLMRLFRLEENDDGEMPLITAVASRQPFSRQLAQGRSTEGALRLILSGEPIFADQAFAGFAGQASLVDDVQNESEPPAPGPGSFDAALDEALRTPLDRIIESAERISEREDGPLRSDYAAYASDISTAARHLLSVIASMGTRTDEGRDTIDLAALSAEAVVMVEPTAEERQVSIVLESARSLPARGEERAVIQVLVNLIGNAVRHSPNGGTVTLRFRRSTDESCVTVIDEGPGIDQLDQQRIFERFERATPQEGGSGLGLAISRRLARSMGGEIELESRPNSGARFTLRLPAA